MKYKIIVQMPTQGIERSLPYPPFEDEVTAKIVAHVLDSLFQKEGYIHRIEPAAPWTIRYKPDLGKNRR